MNEENQRGYHNTSNFKGAISPELASIFSELIADGWFMPSYEGHYICQWLDDIRNLKRAGKLPQALNIARGCMEAMISASHQNPVNVMEYYVIQVAMIQDKQKDYLGEVETIERWLGIGLEAPREDLRINLCKRLAKAREMIAEQQGEDPSEYRDQWRYYINMEKEYESGPKKSKLPPRSGESILSYKISPSAPYRHLRKKVKSESRSKSGSGWVAPRDILSSSSFVSVDFETANSSGVSACQIALVKVSNGQVVERASTLIKPPPNFNKFKHTKIHKISAIDVQSAPTWPEIATWVAEFHSGLPVYAHNAQFDARVWRELDDFYNTHTIPDNFFCSYRTVKEGFTTLDLDNYRLPTVVGALVPGFNLRHHDAESDAEACALIIAALQSKI